LHLCGRVNQDHLGNVDWVRPVGLFRKEPLVNVQSLEVDGADEATVTAAQLVAQQEYLVNFSLVFKLDQIVEKFVDDLLEERTLCDRSCCKEHVDLLS